MPDKLMVPEQTASHENKILRFTTYTVIIKSKLLRNELKEICLENDSNSKHTRVTFEIRKHILKNLAV